MLRGKKVPLSPVVSRSRELREQTRQKLQESFLFSESAGRHSPASSSQLCRQSDELLRRSQTLRERLRKIRDAA